MPFFPPVSREVLEAAIQDLNSQRRDSDDKLRFLQLGFGVSKFLVLPPYSSAGVIAKAVWYHRNLPGGAKDSKVYCPAHTDKEQICPVCHALRMLSEARGKDISQSISKWNARATTYVNVIPLMVPDGKVEVQNKPHILIGPPKFAGFLLEAQYASGPGEDYDAFFDIEDKGCLVLRLEKTKTGPEVFNVDYSWQFLPSRIRPANTPEELKAIGDEVYDLDKIFRFSEKAWNNSVQFANSILQSLGFAALSPSDYPQCPEKYKPAKKTKDATPAATTAPAETVAAPQEQKPSTAPMVFDPTSKRDYTNINPTTMMPVCNSYHNKSDECAACPYEDTCIPATARRLAKAATT